MDRRQRRLVWSAPFLLFACGCLGPTHLGGVACPILSDSFASTATIEAPAAELPAGQLMLAQFEELALRHHPDLRMAEARSAAARGHLVQAGLYPNPSIGWGAEEVGTPEHRAGKQGPTFAQTIVTAGKLGIAQAAALQGVAVADWQAVTRRYEMIGQLRLRYYDALAAQEEVRVNEELVKIAQEGLSAAERVEKAGAGGRPDVLRAQGEIDQAQNRLDVAGHRAEAAWRLLIAATGLAPTPMRKLDGQLNQSLPDYDFGRLQASISERSSEVHAARATLVEAEHRLMRAQVEHVPNVHVELHPMYSFPDQSALIDVGVAVTLPCFDRNQGNVFAAQAEVARARAVIHQVEISLTTRLATALQEYQSARSQVTNYEKRILPNAVESLRLVMLFYDRGDPKYDYTAVFQARAVLAQARLSYVQALRDQQRAASAIATLLELEPTPDKKHEP